LAEWLFPGLLEVVDGHTMMLEANYDIHCLGLPAGPMMWGEAIANCEALQEDLQTGKIDRKARAMSLIEVLKRKEIIKRRE
jgi:hypothetical protein